MAEETFDPQVQWSPTVIDYVTSLLARDYSHLVEGTEEYSAEFINQLNSILDEINQACFDEGVEIVMVDGVRPHPVEGIDSTFNELTKTEKAALVQQKMNNWTPPA